MLQIVYISTPVGSVDIAPIFDTSRRDNARSGITGLLYADGYRFLQALEGNAERVEALMMRICRDPRHRALVVLSCRDIETREFGGWSLAERRPDMDGVAFMQQIAVLTANASPSIGATFDGLARLKRTA